MCSFVMVSKYCYTIENSKNITACVKHVSFARSEILNSSNLKLVNYYAALW